MSQDIKQKKDREFQNPPFSFQFYASLNNEAVKLTQNHLSMQVLL